MPERSETKHDPMRIGLLGASFDRGNQGCSALAVSLIKLITDSKPNAMIYIYSTVAESVE